MYSQSAYNKSTIRVIFYFVNIRSLTSIFVFLFSRTPYTHCAIEINGALYDCVNGLFQCNGRIENIDRKHYIYDTGLYANDNTLLTLEYMLKNTTSYKYSIILRIIFNLCNYKKPYCTQAIAILLKESGYDFDLNKRIGFSTILTKIRKNNRIQN